MANDNSLASKMEVWIRDTIRALAAFADRDVDVFEGSPMPDGQELISALENKGSPKLVVLFEGDIAIELEEGEQRYEPTYAIYAVVKNERDGAARTGDGTVIGTNGIRDELRTALHDKHPNLAAGGYTVDVTEFRGSRLVYQRRDLFVMKSTLVASESPTA